MIRTVRHIVILISVGVLSVVALAISSRLIQPVAYTLKIF